MTVLRPFALRTVVLAAITAAIIVLWLNSNAASDPLGLGLLVFMAYIVIRAVRN